VGSDTWTELVAGPLDGPSALAELFHENSKITRSSRGLPSSEVSRQMQEMWQSLPYDNFPAVDLPPPLVPEIALAEAVAGRHSAHGLRPIQIGLDALATILAYGYGVTRDDQGSTGKPASTAR
jgi:hypothetical protein